MKHKITHTTVVFQAECKNTQGTLTIQVDVYLKIDHQDKSWSISPKDGIDYSSFRFYHEQDHAMVDSLARLIQEANQYAAEVLGIVTKNVPA